MSRDLSPWAPEIGLGLVLGLLAAVELSRADPSTPTGWLGVIAAGTVAAAMTSRHRPSLALALVWIVGALHLWSNAPLLLVELSIALVAFGCARWGRAATVVASAVSIPLAAVVGLVTVATYTYFPISDRDRLEAAIDLGNRFGSSWTVVALALPLLLLAVPWSAGLAVRYSQRARSSAALRDVAEEQAARALKQSEQAQEIARLREGQARLARDVHDVVGHSLAVILAQAESAQYVPDVDAERLKQTMATIATTARASLQDVRQVLAAGDELPEAPPRPLDTLVDGVRASGHEVVARELGTPQPMPPELEVVAYRVLQEMLTNAVKHGSRDEPVFVERHWPDGAFAGELRIEVRNAASGDGGDGGQGLEGMRQRLAAAGGRLDVRRREEPDAVTFTVTAWVPVSDR